MTTDPASRTRLADSFAAIAEAAGACIMAIYGTAEAAAKADGSPVTEADLAAHRVILERLARDCPGVAVVSEEDAAHRAPDPQECFILVDPLDGTREFISRNGEFTVNIALVEAGVAVFGVIQQPVTGALWHGAPGGGAFRRTEGGDLALRTRVPAARPLRVAASRSHRDARTQALLDALPAHETLACGSSLKFCRIAEGEIDLYPRFGPTSEWDTAAGQAILEAAGGAVLDPRGRPFRYNQREGLLNGDFVALGDPTLRAVLPA